MLGIPDAGIAQLVAKLGETHDLAQRQLGAGAFGDRCEIEDRKRQGHAVYIGVLR